MKFNLLSLSKFILVFIVIFSIGTVLGITAFLLNNLEILKPPIVSPAPRINAIEISADGKLILNSKTKKAVFAIENTQKYLRDSGYEYNPDTFHTTNAKYEGDCFLSAALSNNKDRIVFSTDCLPGDLSQAWIGIYRLPDERDCVGDPASCPLRAFNLPHIKFLIGDSGRNFSWSADDKTITYEADLGLSGMTETRTIDSVTGEILDKNNTEPISIETKTIPYEIIKDIASANSACQDKKVITPDDYSLDAKTFDLNNDEVAEIIIDVYKICETSLMPADNGENYSSYVYQKINGKWTEILGGGSSIGILDTKTDGYNDLISGQLLSAVMITTARSIYSWDKFKSTYEEINSIIESSDEGADKYNNYIEDWNNYVDYKHNFEISYPIGLGAERNDTDKYRVTINLGSADDPSIITINLISQETLNATGITYCGAYPNDTKRCESIIIDGKNYTIEKTDKSESVMIGLPSGNAASIVLDSATSETDIIFRKIISTFKFIK